MTKKEPRWFQSTLTGGADKGAVDWLKPNDKIVPEVIEVGTALNLRDDGYHIPDFVEDGKECALIIAMDEPNRRPLLVHQTTARKSIFRFILEAKYRLEFRDEIDVFQIDRKWQLKFTRGKEKFSPFTLHATAEKD
tara:strand:+ start:2614 stop:3021 length:408 start_codon:yes stop_codon:yes gene_type:complete